MVSELKKEYSKYTISDNVIWVKHPAIVDKEIGTKIFTELGKAIDEKIDKNKTIFLCYDCTAIKLNNEGDLNGFKQTIIDFHNSVSHLDTNISLMISNALVRIVAGTISIFVRKKPSIFKSEEEAKAYILTFKPDYK